MANINVVGTLNITIGGQSFGITCPFQNNVACCSENGTYTFFVSGGTGISICPPGGPSWDTSITWSDVCGLNNPPDNVEQVFCDPCVNRCNKNGSPSKYTGSYRWLFTQYVNRSANPIVIPIATYSVSGGYDPKTGKCGEEKICVNGTCLCCNDPDATAEVDLGEKSIDVQYLLKTIAQPYITVTHAQDPTEVCDCYCPGCGPNIFGSCGDYSLNEILNIIRTSESTRCS